MTQEMVAGRFRGRGAVVFVHTGGAFGLFPQRDAFGFATTPAGCGADEGSKLR